MTEQELNINELEGAAGGKITAKDGPGGSAKELPPKAGCIVYKIQPNDKLGVVAKRYNTTVEKIKAVNAGLIVNVNFIRAGYYIYIPV